MNLLKKYSIKALKLKKKSLAGRNNTGKITVRGRGGTKKKIFKYLIDYNRFIWNTPAIVKAVIKAPHHTPYLALLSYPNGILNYIIAPQGLKPGKIIMAGEGFTRAVLGYNMLLKNVPLNVKIHNLELFPYSGGKLIRSAGNWAKITEKTETHALVLLKNGKKLNLNLNCTATIGRVSNINHKQISKRKAGDNRNLNFRPKVRGIAMNAADHPHGGGKGKKSPKNPNYNFRRKLIKGKKTSKKKSE